MTAWSPAKIFAFKTQFYHFLNLVKINSKDLGPIILGEHLFEAQIRYYDAVFSALANDIHDVKHLKSRQLGISTASRAFTLFWIGMFDGLKGYMILDTDAHKEEARLELIEMLDNLPKDFSFPSREKSDGGASNRNILKLSNQSTIIFANAGIRANKTGGVLGRGSGVNFVHASEMCSWDNIAGLESFRNSLSSIFENRLYLWESTGRGFNQWHQMWKNAKEDPDHQVCHFTGWWGKDSQRIRKTERDFIKYAWDKLSPEEEDRIAEVEQLYGWKIDMEQLAWWRRHIDPASANAEGDDPVEADMLQLVEQPWTEHDAFASQDAVFFDPKDLTEIGKKTTSDKYKRFTYYCGYNFLEMKVAPAANQRSVMLKVWEEPDPEGIYVVSVDPSYGANPQNDRGAIQVLRCYADGLDQVAEFACATVNTEQMAWIIAHILGWYVNCYFICEINGPGDAVWRNVRNLKKEVQRGLLHGEKIDDEFTNIFGHVKNFVWQKSDSMFAGQALMMKTTGGNKVSLMERLKDVVSNKMLLIRSSAALQEMESVSRDGDDISAQGPHKDDRVLSLAFGVHFWQDSIRPKLSAQRLTRERVIAKRRLTVRDMHSMFTSWQVGDYFKRKEDVKAKQLREMKRAQRRGFR
jgi:hypothetical protein